MSNGANGKGLFSSSGVTVGTTPQTKWEQKLSHLKGSKVTMGINVPRQSEGAVGDITVREIPSEGNRAYIKTNSGWVDINTMQAADRTKWADMALVNSWATKAAYGKPQYFRDTDGFVHLRGGCDGGTTYLSTITTLPVGFRPTHNIFRYVSRDGDEDYLQIVQVTSVGVVSMLEARKVGYWDDGDTTADVNLEGISFFAGQVIRGSGGGSSSGGGGAGSGGSGGSG
jgi:uncharacterized membrane protein YgcG